MADVAPAGAREPTGMWRYRDRLPVRDAANIVSLGEGDTPLLELSDGLRDELGVASIRGKAEHANPTGSFKDRIASVALSMVVERGLEGCLGTSSGNGGAALAAYAARARRRAVLFTVADILPEKLQQIQALGAVAYAVEGLGSRATGASASRVVDAVAELARSSGFLPFLTGFQYSPEAMQGASTIAFELAEAAADATVVYAPVGGGGLLTAIHRGYSAVAASIPGGMPRLVAVQPTGCATVATALVDGRGELTQGVSTSISGLQVPVLFDAEGAVAAIRESGGHLSEVDDADVWAAQAHLARAEGILVEPAGATALAGAFADARTGRLDSRDRVVVLLTGAGWKDTAALAHLAGDAEVTVLAVHELERALTGNPSGGVAR